MLLAIDAGNSFVKLAYHDGKAWQGQERITLEAFAACAEQLSEQPPPGSVIVSDVAGDPFRGPMLEVLRRWGCGSHWVVARPRGYGLVNSYRVPAQLGSDRWAGLVAARHLNPGANVVASVGTAVTIDALTAAGVFQGGLILPGLDATKQCLAAKTAGVGLGEGEYETFPTSTANAVHTGALLAVAAAVERMVETLGSEAQRVDVVLTGGGAELVAPLIRAPLRRVPDLVLEGLLCIARVEGML